MGPRTSLATCTCQNQAEGNHITQSHNTLLTQQSMLRQIRDASLRTGRPNPARFLGGADFIITHSASWRIIWLTFEVSNGDTVSCKTEVS